MVSSIRATAGSAVLVLCLVSSSVPCMQQACKPIHGESRKMNGWTPDFSLMPPHSWETSVFLELRNEPIFPNPPSLHFPPFLFVDSWVEKGLLAGPRNKSTKRVHILRAFTVTFHLKQRLPLSWSPEKVPRGHCPFTHLLTWLLFCTFWGGRGEGNGSLGLTNSYMKMLA